MEGVSSVIYLFNNQEKLIKILSPNCLKSVEQTQTLTDEKYISDKLYVETRNLSDELLAEVEYIAIQSVEIRQKFDLYFLLRHRQEGELTILDCVQSGIEELMKTPVYDIRPQGTARDHANKILEGSQWSAQYVPESGRGQQNYYYVDAFTALKNMCSFFNIEMQFHVEINGNKIGARYIEFKKRIGQATHKRVTYGHNALEIVKETQKDQIYTALIGRGRGEQVSSAGDTTADGKVQESDGYSRKITFEDIIWSKDKGDPVNKPKGQRYVEDEDATQRFGIITSKGVKPKIGFVEFDTEDREELLQRTYEILSEYSRPRVELKTSAVYLDARIGDTVRVVRHDLNIDYPVRVFELKWDRLTDSVIELKLGDILHESASKRQSRMMNAIRDAIAEGQGEIIDKIIDHLPSADGFNTNWYSLTEPENPRVGDIWFAPDPENEGHYIMYSWDGTIWQEIVRTKNWTKVDNVIKEFESKVKEFDEQFQATQERNQSELDAFRKELDSLDLPTDVINDMEAKINALRDRTEMSLDLIGNDGVTRYNKNLLKGEFKRKVLFDNPITEIVANDGGFKAGQTYTISFDAICEMLKKAILNVHLDSPFEILKAQLKLVPERNRLESFEVESSSHDNKFNVIADEPYQITISGDWYKEQTFKHSINTNETKRVEMQFKDTADGNLDNNWIGEWAERPEIIFKERN